MNTKEIETKKLLPRFMQEDSFFVGLSNGMDKIFSAMGKTNDLLSRVGKTDELPEEILDEIAKENNIFWYYKDDTLDAKRATIKNFRRVQNSLGTPWAMQNVLDEIYGEAELIEHKDDPEEYAPHNFAVFVPNQSTFTAENKKRLLKRINDIKRASQLLSDIYTATFIKTPVYHGTFVNNYHRGVCEKMAVGYNYDEEVIKVCQTSIIAVEDTIDYSVGITE